jgi:MarR family transcriptional regulator, 2-MHQ and catechol-resistance regulon repressor
MTALSAYVKLLRAHRAVIARVERGLVGTGLTLTQFGVLEALLHKGSLTQRDLGRLVLTSPGNLTEVIDRLAARGFVRRAPLATDRRSVVVTLTDQGNSLIAGLFPGHAQDIAAAMAGLAEPELAALDDLLERLGKAAAAEGG